MRQRLVDGDSDLRIDSLDHIFFWQTKPDISQIAAEICCVIWHCVVQTSRVPRIRPSNRLHHQRRITHRLRERAGLIERRCKRDQTKARNAPIAWLKAHYTGKCCRLTDRSARVRAERGELFV